MELGAQLQQSQPSCSKMSRGTKLFGTLSAMKPDSKMSPSGLTIRFRSGARASHTAALMLTRAKSTLLLEIESALPRKRAVLLVFCLATTNASGDVSQANIRSASSRSEQTDKIPDPH